MPRVRGPGAGAWGSVVEAFVPLRGMKRVRDGLSEVRSLVAPGQFLPFREALVVHLQQSG